MLSPIVTTCRKCTSLQSKTFPTGWASSSWKYVVLFRLDSHWDKCKSKLHTCAEYEPTAWQVPNACAQPYHHGRDSHEKLFTLIRAQVFKDPLLPRQVQSTPLSPAQHNTYGCCWLETARQFSHSMRREGGSAFLPISALVNPVRQTGQEVGWCTCVTCF